MTTPNPWLDYLNDDFDRAYNAYRPQTGSNSFLDYWLNNSNRVEQDYDTAQSRLALEGLPPNQEYTDFLEPYNFLRQYSLLGPDQRGASRGPASLRWFIR